jgi:hypothetical protein
MIESLLIEHAKLDKTRADLASEHAGQRGHAHLHPADEPKKTFNIQHRMSKDHAAFNIER